MPPRDIGGSSRSAGSSASCWRCRAPRPCRARPPEPQACGAGLRGAFPALLRRPCHQHCQDADRDPPLRRERAAGPERPRQGIAGRSATATHNATSWSRGRRFDRFGNLPAADRLPAQASDPCRSQRAVAVRNRPRAAQARFRDRDHPGPGLDLRQRARGRGHDPQRGRRRPARRRLQACPLVERTRSRASARTSSAPRWWPTRPARQGRTLHPRIDRQGGAPHQHHGRLQALCRDDRAGPGHAQRPTRFSMVRFGNVLGSSGSVIPLFQEQIARAGRSR